MAELTFKDIDAAIALFAEAFPKTFVREQHLEHRPLKLGIDRDIAERLPELDRAARSTALQNYVSRVMYLQGCVEGAPRYGLDGEVAGDVSVEHAAGSASRLAAILKARTMSAIAARIVRRANRKPKRETIRTPSPALVPEIAAPPTPAEPVKPAKLGLSALREAAMRRKAEADADRNRAHAPDPNAKSAAG